MTPEPERPSYHENNRGTSKPTVTEASLPCKQTNTPPTQQPTPDISRANTSLEITSQAQTTSAPLAGSSAKQVPLEKLEKQNLEKIRRLCPFKTSGDLLEFQVGCDSDSEEGEVATDSDGEDEAGPDGEGYELQPKERGRGEERVVEGKKRFRSTSGSSSTWKRKNQKV